MPGIQKVLHYGSSNSDWESSEMFHLQRESLFYLLCVWALKCFVLAPADTIKPLFIIPSVSDSTITCFHFITCVFGSILREREREKNPKDLVMQPQGFKCFDQKQHWASHIVPWRTSALNPGVFFFFCYGIISYLHPASSFQSLSLSSSPRWFITVILLGSFVICIEVSKSNSWPLWSLWLVLKWFLQLFCIQICYIILLDGFCVFDFDVFGQSMFSNVFFKVVRCVWINNWYRNDTFCMFYCVCYSYIK